MSNAPVTTPAASPTSPGALLAGKYRVERVLGQGGMGVVVEARHIALDERVALKFLLPDYATHPEASARFLREARNAVKIKSEHVARVSDVGTLDTGAPYMVMEFLEGRDLAGTLEKTGVLSVPDAVDYIIQGSEAIAEAHSYGIVHRDLKPANLFLSKRPDGSPIIKVLDFGISKSGGAADNLTKTTAAMGSALYMSPEQMQQTRSVDHRTDIYALGISLYELLAGKQPFWGDTLPQLVAVVLTGAPTPLRDVRPDVSPALAAVIERAYARDRAQRFQSIGEFVIALAPWAPPRSAPTIERVARMAGLPVPEAQPASSGVVPVPQQGAAADVPPTQRAPVGAAPSSGGFVVSPPQQGGAPPNHAPANLLGTRPTVPLPAMDPTAPPPQPPPAATGADAASQPSPPARSSNPNQIVPGHYVAPMSVRASAAFKSGTFQAPTIAGQPRSKAGLIAVLVIGMLGLGGIGTALALKAMKGNHPDPAPTPVVSAPAPPPQPTSADTHPAGNVGDPPPKPAEPPKPADGAAAGVDAGAAKGAATRPHGAQPRTTATAEKRTDDPKKPNLGNMY